MHSTLRIFAAGIGLLVLTLAPAVALAAWPADTLSGLPLTLATNDQTTPIVVSDGHAGLISVWLDYRKPGFDPDLYARRVNANGDTLWDPGGSVVCNVAGIQNFPVAIPDGRGGVFVSWTDSRSGSPGIYVQRLGPDGQRLLTANGKKVADGFNSSFTTTLCPDGAGGMFISWTTGPSVQPGTQVQRLDSTGTKLWTIFLAEGVTIHPVPSAPLAMIPDGSGGALIALSSGNRIKIQHIDSSGGGLWGTSALTVRDTNATLTFGGMVTDGLGGAVMTWVDHGGSADIYAQRILGAGALMWPGFGVPVCIAPNSQGLPRIRSLPNQEVVVAWNDARSSPSYEIRAQRLAADGAPQWLANGVAVASSLPFFANLAAVPGAGDSTFLVWGTTGLAANVYAQKLDGLGSGLWGSSGATLCGAFGPQQNPAAMSDGAGGLFVVYEDRPSGAHYDIFAHHVDRNGIPGPLLLDAPGAGPPAALALRCAPNPWRGSLRVAFSAPALAGQRIEVLDIAGRRVSEAALESGATEWSWSGIDSDGAAVPAGLYFVRVRGGTQQSIGRVVRLP